MAQKHYTIDNEKRTVNVVMERANDKELKLIKKYINLGYVLVPIPKAKPVAKSAEEKAAEKAAKVEKAANNPFSEVCIRKFLEEHGTAAQRKEYNRRYNEQAHDKNNNPVFYKTDSKEGKFKKGDPKVKGHIATLSWFKNEFPNYPE